MIKIPEIVEELIRERPFLEKSLADDIINLTSLARLLQPEIEKRLKKPVQTGAIVMAIKRLPIHPSINLRNNLSKISDNIGDLIVRSNLSDYTYSNSPSLVESQKKLLKKISEHIDIFYTFSRGVFESTLVVSSSISEDVKEIFKNEKLVWHSDDLSSITVKLNYENTKIPGFYYHILKSLAWHNINIIEVISTTNEFTIIVKDEYVDKSFSALKKLKSFDLKMPGEGLI